MQLADKDGDGVLSREELDQAKAQIASESPETSPAAPAVETESAKGGEKPAEAEVAASPKDEQPKPESEGEASHYDIVRGTLASILSGAAKRFVETKSFEEIDKDGDGVITKSEIAASLSEMQVDSKEAEEAQKQVMKMADKDGDGVLSREELDQSKSSNSFRESRDISSCSSCWKWRWGVSLRHSARDVGQYSLWCCKAFCWNQELWGDWQRRRWSDHKKRDCSFAVWNASGQQRGRRSSETSYEDGR